MPKFAAPRVVLLVLFIVLCALAALVAARPAHGGNATVVALHAAKHDQPGGVSFIDHETMTVIGTAAMTQSPWPLRYDATRRVLYLLGTQRPGLMMPKDKKPNTVWAIEPDRGTSTRIGEAERGILAYFTDAPGTRLYTFTTTPKGKTTSIVAFDLAGRRALDAIASVEHLSSVALAPDGTLLYALCQGKKHKRPKGPPGNLHVLDARSGAELARHDVGTGASSIAFDAKRELAYVLGAADEAGTGRLTVLRREAVVEQLDLATRPLGLAPGPDGTAYLLARRMVAALAEDGLSVARTWPVEFSPGTLLFDPPHERMFTCAAEGSKIAEIDLAGGTVVVEHATGSAAAKAGKGLGLALLSILVLGASTLTGAPVVPAGQFSYPSMSMALGPGSAFLYVLNPFTNDISVYDTVKHDVVAHIPTGGGSSRIVRVDDDPNIWIESRSHLVRLNTSTHLIDRTVQLTQGLYRAAVGYDLPRGRAWLVVKTKLRVLDLRTGQLVSTMDLPTPAFGVWIDDSRIAESSPPQP